jgi:hypothetical protein
MSGDDDSSDAPPGMTVPFYREDSACPADPPLVRTLCIGTRMCSYYYDGPCGAKPDQIWRCFDGSWRPVAPAIACPGTVGPVECQTPTLVEYCANRQCPLDSKLGRALACQNSAQARVLEEPNECDGVSIRRMFGEGGTIYHYDATDTLVGITRFDDVPYPPCNRTEYVYGKNCLPGQRFCSAMCTPLVCNIDGDEADAGAQ